MSQLNIGDKAPDFTLQNQHDQEISLSDFKGKKVLISFHPLAWTSVCEIQMRTLEVKAKRLEELNTVAVGISVDSLHTKGAWADYLEIDHVQFLADFWPHGEVAKRYGNFVEKAGVSGRANYLADENGKLIFVKSYPLLHVPDIEAIIEVMEKS